MEHRPAPIKIADLPGPILLMKLMKSLAMLDAILSYHLGLPVFSFNDQWARQQSVGIIDNGQGDKLFFVFEAGSCFVKGHSHEHTKLSDVSYQSNLIKSLPSAYMKHLSEPALECADATFFAWNDGDSLWHTTTGKYTQCDDGSSFLFSYIMLEPQDYLSWAIENYEIQLILEPIEQIYNHTPLSSSLAQSIKSDLKFKDIQASAMKIGYPIEEATKS